LLKTIDHHCVQRRLLSLSSGGTTVPEGRHRVFE
jgi:hypothetical protein